MSKFFPDAGSLKPDEVRVFAEIMFEQVQQDIQNALFHCPSACVNDAVEVKKLGFSTVAAIGGNHLSFQFHDQQHGRQLGRRQSAALDQ